MVPQLTKTLGSVDFDRGREEMEIVQGEVSRWNHLMSCLCSGTTSLKYLNGLKLILQRVYVVRCRTLKQIIK